MHDDDTQRPAFRADHQSPFYRQHDDCWELTFSSCSEEKADLDSSLHQEERRTLLQRAKMCARRTQYRRHDENDPTKATAPTSYSSYNSDLYDLHLLRSSSEDTAVSVVPKAGTCSLMDAVDDDEFDNDVYSEKSASMVDIPL